MILYALVCTDGHRFESWFQNAATCDDQVRRGLVACPRCHSVDVAKTIMAPAVGRGAPAIAPTIDSPLRDTSAMAARQGLRMVREHLLNEREDVGGAFATQARQMHEGDIPFRPIHGRASSAEARALVEDGVAILPLPRVPDELN